MLEELPVVPVVGRGSVRRLEGRGRELLAGLAEVWLAPLAGWEI